MSSSEFSRNIKGRISSMANWSGGRPEEENEEPQAFGEKLRQEMEAATATVPIQEVELELLLDNPYQYLARRNMDETSMQELVDSIEPGRGSFLVEGTLAYKLAKGASASICGGQCRHREDAVMERIAVEGWGLPKVGAAPK